MENEKYNLNSDYFTTEEQEALDLLLLPVAETAKEEDSRLAIINPQRIFELLHAYKIVKSIAKKTNCSVWYTLHQPFKSMGVVSIVGKSLLLTESELFVKVATLASNLEVYPKTDGTIQMNLTFHGLTNYM